MSCALSLKEKVAGLRTNPMNNSLLTSIADDDGKKTVENEGYDLEEAQDEQRAAKAEDLSNYTAHIFHMNLVVDENAADHPTNFIATNDARDNTTAYPASARDTTLSHTLTGRLQNDSRYDEEYFYIVMVDTGCPRASSGRFSQYRAYCQYVVEPQNIKTNKTV